MNEIKFDDPNKKVTFEEPSEQGQSETKASTKAPREMPQEEDEFAGQIEKTMVDIEELQENYKYNLQAKSLTEQAEITVYEDKSLYDPK